MLMSTNPTNIIYHESKLLNLWTEMLHNGISGEIKTGAGDLKLLPKTNILYLTPQTCIQTGPANTIGRIALISDATPSKRLAWCLDNGSAWILPHAVTQKCC